MTLSIWRYAHLALAIISSAFLIILSVTGVILAFDAIDEKTPDYRVENFNDINLAQVLPTLRENYFEVTELKVDHNKFVTISAIDEDGNNITGYINPTTGEKIGNIEPKSDFINWITSLHRSLFLKETGRIIVGIVSFILLLISISGLMLIVKRQQGLRHFFAKVNKDFFAQYFHVVTGRWLLIPVFIIALTGTLIFMTRLEFFKGDEIVVQHKPAIKSDAKDIKDFDFFKNTKLRSVERIEFPFIPDDEAEPFIVHLRKKTVTINQINGDIISETVHPYSAVIEKFNVDLHTGRTSIIWAIVLGLASLNILFFIYSGFAIMLRRTKTKIKNKHKAKDAEIVLLIGSENGTTISFANQIHQQLLSQNKKSYLAQLNDYQAYPKAKELVVLTSTYGLGEAPSSAINFEKLLIKTTQSQEIGFSVVGFGSKSYPDFCTYAYHVDRLLANQKWAKRSTEIYTINDRSVADFVLWTSDWSLKTNNTLSNTAAVYNVSIPSLKTFKVIAKTEVSEDNSTFKTLLKPLRKQKLESGDLLAIYPDKDNKERFYSIGMKDNAIQLVVKLFPDGFGSGYLNRLKIGEEIQARVMSNPNFHCPKNAKKIVMIANGTGIAPFLGMINDNFDKKKINLYAGFRNDNSLVKDYRNFANESQAKGHLENINFAFSREENNKQYVMDLIKRDQQFIADLLNDGGTIMICGALQMQKDVEETLNVITQKYHQKPLAFYQEKKQILTDCY